MTTWRPAWRDDGTGQREYMPIPYPPSLPWPTSRCLRAAGTSAWRHYLFNGVDTYVFAGSCLEFDHHGYGPHDPRPCCCRRDGCDGTGPWPTEKNT